MDEKLREKVEKTLENIRPYLVADGGDVQILSIKNGVLTLELLGNCGGK